MAKASGLGANCYIHGVDLSGDVVALPSAHGGPALLDCTSISKSAYERIGGVRDGGMEITSWFNPTLITAEHAVFAPLPRTDVIATYVHRATLGEAAASCVAKQIDYKGTRANDGSYTFDVEADANAFGLEWGTMLTTGVQSVTAGNGTGFQDNSATTAFGLQMYVHVFSFTGTSITVKLQGSSDNGGGDAYADLTGATTAALTAIGATRVATANNLSVESWIRPVYTGTFSACTLAIQVVRNFSTTDF